MKKPKYPYRIAIIMFILTIPPIGATQLGWYLYDKQTGFDYGMIIGTFSVIFAAWLMYEKKWREEDEDQLMEKIIFFGLVIPILGFVLYLGATAIMKGFSAKSANKANEISENEKIDVPSDDGNNLSDEIERLNQLLNDGILTQEEFEKAKKNYQIINYS